MLLESINSPADLRRLDPEQLAVLAGRSGIHRPGRLGHRRPSGLQPGRGRAHPGPAPGVPLAPGHHPVGHRPPGLRPQDRDRPPGDVSPRCARPAGLSGYPSRAESVHDWVENSHASTILSYAHGLAAAVARSSTPDRRVVAVIGDGSMTGGHGLRGAQQPRPQRQPGRGRPQRQRPLLRPDRLPAVREPDQAPPAPRPALGAVPDRGRPARPARRSGSLAYSSLQGALLGACAR